MWCKSIRSLKPILSSLSLHGCSGHRDYGKHPQCHHICPTMVDDVSLNKINECYPYGHSSYSGIHPVLWDSPLLCSEVVEDKSPKTDVVETYMKIIWVIKIMVKNQTVQEIYGCVDLANFEAGFLVILKLWGELTSWPNHSRNYWFFKWFWSDWV